MKPLSPEAVLKKATKNLLDHQGDLSNRKHLLGFFEIQFGIFQGQTFKWLLENALGYAAYLVAAMKRDPTGGSKDTKDHASNKESFREYMEMFPSAKTAVAMKEEQWSREKTQPNLSSQPGPSMASSSFQTPSTSNPSAARPPSSPSHPKTPQPISTASLSSLLVGNLAKDKNIEKAVKRLASPFKVRPSLIHARPHSTSTTLNKPAGSLSSSPALVGSPFTLEASPSSSSSSLPVAGPSSPHPTVETSINPPQTPPAFGPKASEEFSTAAGPKTPTTFLPVSSEVDDSTLLAEALRWDKSHSATQRVCLPAGWLHTLPEVDQRWMSKALFKWTAQGHPELDFSRVDRLWWYPPQFPLHVTNVPQPEDYFGSLLFLWMPRKLWQVKLTCPHSDCHKGLLTSSGVHQKIRQVISLDITYFVASEYLVCKICKRKVISWSHAIVSQLDVGHRGQFPCILTSKLACDLRVVTLMRQRGLGNSSSQIRKKVQESHSEVWLKKTVQYLTDCKQVKGAVEKGLIRPVTFSPPPPMPTVPKHRWMMQVYAQDVLQRLTEVKASVTSTYGRILKLDSTKKVARKLAGRGFGTATWATNVGNEHGQIIMSVLTASEGFGLGPMIEGLIRRYAVAGVPPPEVLYVDRDCCGNTLLRRMFQKWKDLHIRLDIWHFMRRFSVGCTTDSHQLYASFMRRLSHCLFMWDEEDLTALKIAKRSELSARLTNPSDADVLRSISRSELALHCRRTTRGSQETLALIKSLIQAFDGDNGRDTLGVPLINSERMAGILAAQAKHVACIQDPPGIQLYTRTGTILKGGHRLPTYRCARGSTSLESFHLHLNRFIPGTLASDVFFQAYLLDGLARWNEDRAVAATSDKQQQPCSYDHLLRHAANSLSEEVLGQEIVPYTGPRKYTGELLGVEYLYQQTGKVLQDYRQAVEESETMDMEIEDSFNEPEEFEDFTVATLEPVRTFTVSSTSSLAPTSSLSAPDPQPGPSWSPPPPEGPSTSATHSAPGPTSPSPSSSPSATTSVPPCVLSPAEQSTSKTDLPATPQQLDSSCDDSVGPDNVEGYGAVQELADFLVGLRHNNLVVTAEESNRIVSLWQSLGDYDKQKTFYSQRHQAHLKQGRFRATKKIVAPGVESTKRCFIGAHSPAQWPDCNRVSEAIFVRLCALYPNAVRCEGKKVSRFTMVVRMYRTIRECVVSNARIMSETTIQLPEVNAATVTQWYSRRCRAQEKLILNQGIPQPAASMAATEKLPDPLQKGTPLQVGTSAQPHIFVLPPNTAGEAKLKAKPQLQALAPQLSSTPFIIPSGSTSQVLVPPVLNVPFSFVLPPPPAVPIILAVPPSPHPLSIHDTTIPKEENGSRKNGYYEKEIHKKNRNHNVQQMRWKQTATIPPSVLWELVL
ncbi:uncharacterized protein LOC110013889 [Oryzias latipes]